MSMIGIRTQGMLESYPTGTLSGQYWVGARVMWRSWASNSVCFTMWLVRSLPVTGLVDMTVKWDKNKGMLEFDTIVVGNG